MDTQEKIVPEGYEYYGGEVPPELNFLSDLHGPDGMVSYAEVMALIEAASTKDCGCRCCDGSCIEGK